MLADRDDPCATRPAVGAGPAGAAGTMRGEIEPAFADGTEGPEWAVATSKAAVFKALAHPARVRVLDSLAGGERSVGRLADELGMEISHLSHHLAVLRRTGLVSGRRERSVVFYALRHPQLTRRLGLLAGEVVRDGARGPRGGAG